MFRSLPLAARVGLVAASVTGVSLQQPKSSVSSCSSASEISSPTLTPWSARWKANNTSWQLPKMHHTLEKWAPKAFESPPLSSTSSRRTVLVPLCGKTVDLAALCQQGYSVVGVEGVHQALVHLCLEQCKTVDFDPLTSTPVGAFESYKGSVLGSGKSAAGELKVLKGDFFDLGTLGQSVFDFAWDRAALVAVQPDRRAAYVAALKGGLKAGGVVLLSTYERRDGSAAAVKGGPPFSIGEREVRELFGEEEWEVTMLEEIDMFAGAPYTAADAARWRKAGLSSMFELVFLIKKKEKESSTANQE